MTWPAHLENQAFLPSIGEWELNLAVQPPRSQQSWIQRVSSICGHDDLDIHRLVKTIHLVEKLHKDALHLQCGIHCCIPCQQSRLEQYKKNKARYARITG